MPVRVAFLGNDPWSVPALDALVGEPETAVVVVGTNPPRPAGRGNEPRPTAVADAARAHGLPLVETERVSSGAGLTALEAASPDVVVVVAYGEILRREVLALAGLGTLNVHLSLLPRWRGASPVQHALLAGDERTGVTVMRMDEGLDTGPVLGTLEDDIRPDDDAGSLGDRLARLGGMLLVGVIRQLATDGLPERPQDEAKATWAPKLGPADRALRWDEPAGALARRVRALSPEPGATTTFRGDPLKVLAAAVGHDRSADDTQPGTIRPGAIVAADDRGVAVATGDGVLRLLEVAPAGRRRMAASEWANGARFAPHERLGP
ncbi:MAG TPA: methionyl-tRNA formyltransferase [Actinomycetota bacterium]|nr:methionyl-tRNA formyltransferase [Actinomycetota bacterium]